MHPVTCSQCGHEFLDERPESVPPNEQRNPCPTCGSKARTLSASAVIEIQTAVTAQASLILHSEMLMDLARAAVNAKQFELATILSHTACEVGARRAFSEALRKRGLAASEEAIFEVIRNFNIVSHPKVRTLLESLSGQSLPDRSQFPWKQLEDSVKRRNGVAHHGNKVTQIEAQESVTVADKLVQLLKTTFG